MPDINEIIAKFKEYTKRQCVKINTEKAQTGPFDSSFGGAPYLPNGFEYPFAENCSDSGNVPMVLLAQINFEEVPKFGDFPEKGILQIFINPTDDLYGLDFDNPTEQKNFKIFYHADVDKDLAHQQTPPSSKGYYDEDDIYSPVSVPLKLSFELSDDYLGVGDDHFFDTFIRFYNEETGSSYDKLFDMPNEITDVVFDELSACGHKLGGSPYFTQFDPREDETLKYETLLLQIDSDFGEADGEDLILWGDAGVGNFFIKPEDLKACRFDDVFYNWDCS